MDPSAADGNEGRGPETNSDRSHSSHPQSPKPIRPTSSATSPQPALDNRLRSRSQDVPGVESTEHSTDQANLHKERPTEAGTDEETIVNDNDRSGYPAHPKLEPRTSRRAWYDEEIERLGIDINRLVQERAEIRRTFAEEKEQLEATIEDQQKEIEELRQDRDAIATMYEEFRRGADGVFDRPTKRRRP